MFHKQIMYTASAQITCKICTKTLLNQTLFVKHIVIFPTTCCKPHTIWAHMCPVTVDLWNYDICHECMFVTLCGFVFQMSQTHSPTWSRTSLKVTSQSCLRASHPPGEALEDAVSTSIEKCTNLKRGQKYSHHYFRSNLVDVLTFVRHPML